MPRSLVVGALAALLLVLPAGAQAADTFVGKSRAGATDAGPCTDAAAPCATIQAAVDKSQAEGGGTVRVLANPDGATTDTYAEAPVIPGAAPVTLIGAGRRANGTRVAPTTGPALTLGAGAAARSLAIVAQSGVTAVSAAAGSTLDEVTAEASGGTGYAGAGRVEDSKLVAATGAVLDAGRLVRTEVLATVEGIHARLGTSSLLHVIVRARPTSGNPPTGAALRVGGAGRVAGADLWHGTLTDLPVSGAQALGFPVRLRIDGRAAAAALRSANTTLAAAGGTDLQLLGGGARATLRTVNRSPVRTSLTDGAVAGQLSDTDPVDLVPGLTPDGNLSPSSPLIDRGTRQGDFGPSDIHGSPRVQGAGPDIGADELPPARADGLRWTMVDVFRDPMWVASAPGDLDRVFVAERDGRIFVVEGGRKLATPALDINEKVTEDGEAGLQSIAFAPDFAQSGRVYGFYTRVEDPVTPETELGDIVIAEWSMDASDRNLIDEGRERQVMLLEHSARRNHNGGGMAFGPDGYLWLSLGDGDTGPIPSQDLSRPLGKILRIDPRQSDGQPYAVPPDNPFVGQAGKLPEIWAYGLRNPFRMDFDRETGDLWVGDVGQNRFEELNLLHAADGRRPGANFGWQITEGDVLFQTGQPVTSANAPPNYVGPVIVRRHDESDRSITAGAVVRDPSIPSLQGRALYADFFIGVTRAALGAPGGVSADGEVEALPAVAGVTSFSLDGCRRIYATSLSADRVQRLTTTGQCIPPPEACTIMGTDGNDQLRGTGGDDVICGRGGNDRIVGLAGDDLLAGGPGADELIGSAGADVIQGGDGADFTDYAANTQAVTVTVGAGADDGVAGEGDDVQIDVENVRGGYGGDRLTAGARPVRLIGGAGDDALFARDGKRDRLICSAGVDTNESDPIDFVDASCE
jgi:glucose/arabinose dehydrogenase